MKNYFKRNHKPHYPNFYQNKEIPNELQNIQIMGNSILFLVWNLTIV